MRPCRLRTKAMRSGLKVALCTFLVICWVSDAVAEDSNSCFEKWSLGDTAPRKRTKPAQCYPRTVDISGYAQIPQDIVQKYDLKTNFINTSGRMSCYEDGCHPNPVVWSQAEAHWILKNREPKVLEAMKEAGIDGVVGGEISSESDSASNSGDTSESVKGEANAGLRGSPVELGSPAESPAPAEPVDNSAPPAADHLTPNHGYRYPPSPYFMPPVVYAQPPPQPPQESRLMEQIMLKFMDHMLHKVDGSKGEENLVAKAAPTDGSETGSKSSDEIEAVSDEVGSKAESTNPFDGKDVVRLTVSGGISLGVDAIGDGQLRLSVLEKVPLDEE